MSTKRTFTWTAVHEYAYSLVKMALLQPPVLAAYVQNLVMIFSRPALSNGVA